MPNSTRQPFAINRTARLLSARVRMLHEELKSGNKNPEEAVRLRHAFAEIRPDIKRAKELNYSRPQTLAAHALSIDGATARAMFDKMSKVEIHGSIAPLIERANSGDKSALPFLGAMVGVISNMPAEQRPITITKLARLVDMPEYDVAAAEIHEANFFLETAERMLPRLEAGQLPTSQDLMAIGQMRRELDGGGWRDFNTLAEANAELRLSPDEKETTDAPSDRAEPEQPENADGPHSGGEAGASASDAPTSGGEADQSGADQSRPESPKGEQV